MKHNRFNKNFITSVLYYLKFGYRKEYLSWRWVFNYYLMVILTALIVGIFLFNYLQILPPKSVSIAVGQEGSSTQKMATSFQKSFAGYNLKLNLFSGEGPQEGLARLEDKASPVNASFYVAGHINASDHPNIVSLGSVQSAPLWFFYRGEEINTDDPKTAFKGKKIAIGLPGSATNIMFRRLFDSSHFNIDEQYSLQELPYEEAEKKLVNGQIDAMFLVYSFDTDVVQKLIKNEDLHIFDFKLADAYLKKYTNLEKVIIPKGAFDTDQILPRSDITMLSTSIILLAEKGLHPAIQWAFMFAARQHNRHEMHFFSRPGEYPKDVDYDALPLSSVAERYYAGGIPQVFASLPLWMASLIDQLWIQALAFFVLVYPILMQLLHIRSFASSKVKNEGFAYLRFLKIEGIEAQSIDELSFHINQIDLMIKKISTTWCRAEDAKDYMELIYLARDVKAELQERSEQIALKN